MPKEQWRQRFQLVRHRRGKAVKVADSVAVQVEQALKERDASVVYAAPGLEAEAARAAAAIPGGAKVDKLNWKVNAELVVALGKTAGGAK